MQTSEQVIEEIAAAGGAKVLLAFSCGKDSLAAWLALRERVRVVPFYRYVVPGLAFIERSLAYYEDFFGTRILRVPHPSLARMLNALVFQPPERCEAIERARLPELDYEQWSTIIRNHLRLPADTWVASGVRAVDSPLRWRHFRMRGGLDHKRRIGYPVFDWRKDRVLETIRAAGVKLPVDYLWFGRSFDGVDLRFLAPLARHAPEDYARVLEWFPLAELEMKRYEYAQGAG